MLNTSAVTTPFEKDYKYDFCINNFSLKSNFFNTIETFIHRELTKMYDDGVLTLKPKDVKIITEEREIPNTFDDVESIEISFYKKGEEV